MTSTTPATAPATTPSPTRATAPTSTRIVNRGRRSPRFLVLLFDESCPLCRTLRKFLSTRRPIVPIHLVPVGSPRAAELFPGLDLRRAREKLTVVDDVGDLYEGDAAWIVCGWALPALRGLAEHVSSGWRRSLVQSGVRTLNTLRLVGRDPYPERGAEDVEQVEQVAACTDSCPAGLPSWLGTDGERSHDSGRERSG